MALTDRGNMHGALAFSKKATGAGIQPIIATKLRLPLGDKLYGSITLLAQNEQGYTNLCTLVSDSHTPPDDSTGKNPSGSGPTLDTAKLAAHRSEEHTSELQSLMRNSYAVICLKKKKEQPQNTQNPT